jgi:hypothetical protein
MPAKNDFASPDKTIHNVPGAIGSATVLGINDAGQVVGNIFNGAGNVIGQEATASWTLAELGVQSSNASAPTHSDVLILRGASERRGSKFQGSCSNGLRK